MPLYEQRVLIDYEGITMKKTIFGVRVVVPALILCICIQANGYGNVSCLDWGAFNLKNDHNLRNLGTYCMLPPPSSCPPYTVYATRAKHTLDCDGVKDKNSCNDSYVVTDGKCHFCRYHDPSHLCEENAKMNNAQMVKLK